MLIGTQENSELECKRWDEMNMRSTLAKAACGLANAEGGVIIIGMVAKGRANEPDLITAFALVTDVNYVEAKARDFILDSLEPGLRDIQVAKVSGGDDDKQGCVVIYIGEVDGLPQRVKGSEKFHVRMGNGTLTMLYSQLADRFGRRPHADLIVEPAEPKISRTGFGVSPVRELRLFVVNKGRGLARFPALRCLRVGGFHDYAGPYSNQAPRWAFSDDQTDWYSYRGNTNDVIYPGEKIAVASLAQDGRVIGEQTKDDWGQPLPRKKVHFASASLETRVVCDGMPEHVQPFEWEELDYELG